MDDGQGLAKRESAVGGLLGLLGAPSRRLELDCTAFRLVDEGKVVSVTAPGGMSLDP